MKILEILNESLINDPEMDEVLHCHPKQIINDELSIPVWKIIYTYTTARNNNKMVEKYIFLEESAWDLVDNNFKQYIKEFNEKHPERKLSNVKILDAEFLGKLLVPLT